MHPKPDPIVRLLLAFEAAVRSGSKIAAAGLYNEGLSWFYNVGFTAIVFTVSSLVKERQESGESLPKLTDDECLCAEAIADIEKATAGKEDFSDALPILVRLHDSLSKEEAPADAA